MGFNHVPYFKLGEETCACPCFIKPGQHLVSAYNYLLSKGIAPKDGRSYAQGYEYLLNLFGETYLQSMLLLDYIIFNSDRHFKNFGVVQDARTGKIIGPSPIFDCGRSLYAGIGFLKLDPFVNVKTPSRPFENSHSEQIKYVNLSKFRNSLQKLDTVVQGIVEEVYKGSSLRDDHIEGMSVFLRQRIRGLL
jgi:hypothetical protein